MTSAVKVCKPTEAQIKILVELNTTGALPKGARGASLEKLEGWGFIEWIEADDKSAWVITSEGQKEIGVPVVDREKVAQIQEIEELLDTNPWDEAQAVQEVMFGGGENGDKQTPDDFYQALTYDASKGPDYQRLMGFGETLKWRNTKVWDGLTAEQIRKDLDTAGPVNRAARRRGQKISRQFLKALSKAAL